MKKQLAVALALCMTVSMAGTAFAEEEGSSGALYPGSVMNIGVTGSVSSWNPFNGTGSGSNVGQATDMIYENLMDMTLNPVLAYEYDKIDDVTYDFYIYDNIYDSEGNHITAEDVKYSYDLGVNGGNFHGLSIVESVDVIDEYAVEFHFEHEPYIGDLEAVAGQVPIISQVAYEESGDDMVSWPVGTGPYVLTEWVPDSITTVEVRDDYWASEDQLGCKNMYRNIETVNFVVISEASQSTIALESGNIDTSPNITAADLAFFDEGGQDSDNFYVDHLASGLTTVLLPNMSEDSILSTSQELREAVFYAIDVPSLIIGASNGDGIVTYDASNHSLSDYNLDWDDEDNYYHYDMDKAKEKLEESGCTNVDLVIMCQSDEEQTNMATLIQAFLEAIGIHSSIEAYDASLIDEYAADSTSWDLLLRMTGSEDYIVNSWAHLFDPANYAHGMTINFIDDQEMFDLLTTCKTYDGHTAENLDAYHAMLTDNAYAMGLYNTYSCNVVSRKFEVFYNTQMTLIPQASIVVEE